MGNAANLSTNNLKNNSKQENSGRHFTFHCLSVITFASVFKNRDCSGLQRKMRTEEMNKGRKLSNIAYIH